MGKITQTITGHPSNTFTPVESKGPQQPAPLQNAVAPKGYPQQDTVTPAVEKSESGCCPAQDRLSNWFSDMGCLGQTLFVVGSILTAGLLYLFTLLGFACSGDEKT